MTQEAIELGVKGFEGALQKAGVRRTSQRTAIYRELLARSDHPSAEAVLEGVRRQIPGVSLDTVYRTLWRLTELGLISTLGARQRSARFDGNTRSHHHFVCQRCGLVQDFEHPGFDALPLPRAAASLGRMVATHVQVHGICARCQPE